MMGKRISKSYIFESLSGLILIPWLFLPGVQTSDSILTPIEVISYFNNPLFYMNYFVISWGCFLVLSLFLSRWLGLLGGKNSLLRSILSIVATVIIIYNFVYTALLYGDNIGYFISLSTTSLGIISGYILLNIIYVSLFISRVNSKSSTYREYKEFKRVQRINGSRRVKITSFEFLFKIRTKLLLSFIGIMATVIIILSYQLLGNYKDTLIKAIGEGAQNQVIHAASTYKANLGNELVSVDYLEKQLEQNDNLTFGFKDLSIYTNLGDIILIDSEIKLGSFKSEYSTQFPGSRFPEMEPLDSKMANYIFEKYKEGNDAVEIIEDDNYICATAIEYNRIIKDGEKRVKKATLLGFSVITFDWEVINKPFFKVRNIVILLTIIFIYVAIILIYIVGNYIVNPILFLRMNVRKISEILSLMIKGEIRITPTALSYNDTIKSRDEIKYLSSEINDMVTVIRGIVPYISQSTLKHAERGIETSTTKDLCFLFTDIRGFTTLCEGMEPDKVVSILNKYLDLEAEIILNNNGDIDKFVGDEMMASFDGPNKEINACRAATELRKAMMAEMESRTLRGEAVVNIGIGINSGDVVFGSVGARDRKDFTSIGDTVNLAARLEGANKAYGSKSMISERVYDRVKNDFLCRELDFIAVKGKSEPVRIFEILQEKKSAKKLLYKIKETFENGLEAYRKQDWGRAIEYFSMMEEYNDEPSRIFLERVNYFKSNPPREDWDGVFKMKVK